MEKDESRWNRWVRVSQRLRNGFQMAMVSCYNVPEMRWCVQAREVS